MKTKRNKPTGIVDEVRFCFIQMGLSFMELEIEGVPAIKTYIEDGFVVIDVEVMCNDKEKTIGISMVFSKITREEERYKLQRTINFLNDTLMHIGHFVMDPEGMDIYFLSMIPLYGDGLQRKRIIQTLNRNIDCGVKCFNILFRMLFLNPVTVVNDLRRADGLQ
jgi:hypothetical protein